MTPALICVEFKRGTNIHMFFMLVYILDILFRHILSNKNHWNIALMLIYTLEWLALCNCFDKCIVDSLALSSPFCGLLFLSILDVSVIYCAFGSFVHDASHSHMHTSCLCQEVICLYTCIYSMYILV
jgi:hypothetical protein